MSPALLLASAVLFLPALCRAENFLRNRGPRADGEGASDAVGSEGLLAELEDAVGVGRRLAAEAHAASAEADMAATFRALPKLPGGGISPGAARYLLHRYFAGTRGWSVDAFDPRGGAWNASSPAAVFGGLAKDGSAAGVADVFERRASQEIGMSVHDAAVLAATLESLVHDEHLERVSLARRAVGFGDSSALTDRDVHLLMDTYALMVLGGMKGTATATDVTSVLALVRHKRMWQEVRQELREVRRSVVASLPPAAEKKSFDAIAAVLEKASLEVLPRHRTLQCRGMKAALTAAEGGVAGRVPLSSFYRVEPTELWSARETRAFLEQAGALDMTNTLEPSVVIPNYLMLSTNCDLAASAFFAPCCPNECEAIQRHVERGVAAPYAPTAQLLQLVESFEGASRNLSVALVQRLETIAEHHGGKVPIHGRLFAQWLHNVFPRECPFPHVAGVTQKTMTANAVADLAVVLSNSELAAVLELLPVDEAATPTQQSDPSWCPIEELVAVHHGHASAPMGSPGIAARLHVALRGPAGIILAISMLAALLQAAAGARSAAVRPSAKAVCK